MRTLTRPMFNMGGPIKQGIMHGIREPYKGGGKAALVGNPVYPKERRQGTSCSSFISSSGCMDRCESSSNEIGTSRRGIKRMFGPTTPAWLQAGKT